MPRPQFALFRLLLSHPGSLLASWQSPYSLKLEEAEMSTGETASGARATVLSREVRHNIGPPQEIEDEAAVLAIEGLMSGPHGVGTSQGGAPAPDRGLGSEEWLVSCLSVWMQVSLRLEEDVLTRGASGQAGDPRCMCAGEGCPSSSRPALPPRCLMCLSSFPWQPPARPLYRAQSWGPPRAAAPDSQ